MVDAFSRKAMGSLVYVQTIYYLLLLALRKMRVRLDMDYSRALLASFQVWLVLIEWVRESQIYEPYLMKIRGEVDHDLKIDFVIRGDGALVMDTRLCVLALNELKREILDEAYNFPYAMHQKSTKMYSTLWEFYFVGSNKEKDCIIYD